MKLLAAERDKLEKHNAGKLLVFCLYTDGGIKPRRNHHSTLKTLPKKRPVKGTFPSPSNVQLPKTDHHILTGCPLCKSD